VSTVVRVRVGGEQFAFPVSSVREIARVGEISPVPGAGAALLGVRNLRGQVLPVFDLAALLGAATAGPPSRVLVVDEGGVSAGLAIGEVTDVSELVEAGESATVIDVPRLFTTLRERATP
jgi:purine-binding chemotaxis protein CheW